MDKIMLKGMNFYGYHGVFEEEREKGQKFVINAQIFMDLTLAGKTDDLANTVDYGEIYSLIEKITTNGKFKLIECLAEEISKAILNLCPQVVRTVIEVEKPDPPIKGNYRYFGVEIDRGRNEK